MSIPPTLSGNWKQLQQQLKSLSTISTKKDNHKPASDSETPDHIKKRKHVKTSETTTSYRSSKRTKMSSMEVKNAETGQSAGKKAPGEVSASLALWAENNDIPAEDLARAYELPLTTVPSTVGPKTGVEGLDSANTEVGKYVAMDCEMVGVGGRDNERSALARVSIVNFHGNTVLDCFVVPKEKVTDWRTWVSGVKASDMENAITFEEAQQRVADILQDRILVGHAIKNDLDVLLLSHPRRDIRDTSRHPEFRKLSQGKTPGLKRLAKELLGVEIQGGSHSSIEDARACILLYRRHKQEFEKHNLRNFPATNKKNHRKGGGKKKKKT